MKHYKLIFAIFVIMINFGIARAYDARDILIVKGDTITLKQWLLPSYVERQSNKWLVQRLYPELCAVADYVVTPPSQCPPKLITTWVERRGMLYIANIRPYLDDFVILNEALSTEITTKAAREEYLTKHLPPQDSIRARLERLTGEKFNVEGLLPTSWLSYTIEGAKDFVSSEYFLNHVQIVVQNGKITHINSTDNKSLPYDNPNKINSLLSKVDWPWNKIESIIKPQEALLFSCRATPDGKIIVSSSGENQSPKEHDIAKLYKQLSSMIASVLNTIPRNEISQSVYHFQRYVYPGNSLDRFISIELDPETKTASCDGSFERIKH